MHPETGEILNIPTISNGHLSTPDVGDEIEALHDRKLPGGSKRQVRFKWRVVRIIPGNPGRILLEAIPGSMKI